MAKKAVFVGFVTSVERRHVATIYEGVVIDGDWQFGYHTMIESERGILHLFWKDGVPTNDEILRLHDQWVSGNVNQLDLDQ